MSPEAEAKQWLAHPPDQETTMSAVDGEAPYLNYAASMSVALERSVTDILGHLNYAE